MVRIRFSPAESLRTIGSSAAAFHRSTAEEAAPHRADIEIAIRAEELADAGDWAGEAIWRRIIYAIWPSPPWRAPSGTTAGRSPRRGGMLKGNRARRQRGAR